MDFDRSDQIEAFQTIFRNRLIEMYNQYGDQGILTTLNGVNNLYEIQSQTLDPMWSSLEVYPIAPQQIIEALNSYDRGDQREFNNIALVSFFKYLSAVEASNKSTELLSYYFNKFTSLFFKDQMEILDGVPSVARSMGLTLPNLQRLAEMGGESGQTARHILSILHQAQLIYHHTSHKTRIAGLVGGVAGVYGGGKFLYDTFTERVNNIINYLTNNTTDENPEREEYKAEQQNATNQTTGTSGQGEDKQGAEQAGEEAREEAAGKKYSHEELLRELKPFLELIKNTKGDENSFNEFLSTSHDDPNRHIPILKIMNYQYNLIKKMDQPKWQNYDPLYNQTKSTRFINPFNMVTF